MIKVKDVKYWFGRITYYASLFLNSTSDSFIQIVEHQKSGGTWLSRIMATYFDIPFYSQPGEWMKNKGVVRIHAKHQYTLCSARQIYVLRDGRDVLTSYYFHLFYRVKIPQSSHFHNIEDVKNNMPKYLEWYFKKKLNNKILWHSHTSYWMPKVSFVVKYEDLLNDTFATAKNLIEKLDGRPVDVIRLENAISETDFRKLSGREKGQEDHSSFFRKGISGDWKNYFNAESARIFNDYAGDTLIKLGYEKDDSWVSRCK